MKYTILCDLYWLYDLIFDCICIYKIVLSIIIVCFWCLSILGYASVFRKERKKLSYIKLYYLASNLQKWSQPILGLSSSSLHLRHSTPGLSFKSVDSSSSKQSKSNQLRSNQVSCLNLHWILFRLNGSEGSENLREINRRQ